MAEYEFTVVLQRDENNNFVAICPSLQGCYTEGKTEEEAMGLIKDAIYLHTKDRLERGEFIGNEVSSIKIKITL